MKSTRYTVAFLAVILAAATLKVDAAPAKVRQLNAMGRSNVLMTDVAAAYKMALTRPGGKLILSSTSQKRCVFYPEKRYAYLDNIKINLLFAPFLKNGKPYLGKADYSNIVAPYFGPRAAMKRKVGTIVIDPGHGGKDPGASKGKLIEKQFSLELAQLTAKKLRTYGYRVILTRENDRFIELDARSKFANARKADLFIALHINATANKSVSGIESYCLTPPAAPSSNDSGRKAPAASYPGNRWDGWNFLLAYHIQRALLARTKAVDRGVKFARFAVLKGLKCPGVLIECGFVTNPAELAKLRTKTYMDKLATAIAKGVVDYHRSFNK